MNKKILYRLYSGAFICACLVPSVLMPFVKADDSKEKRALAEVPKLKEEDGSFNFDILSDLGDYFSEHFAFRQQFVNADSRLKTSFAGTSPNTDVIAGKHGWLYYGETSDDFLNINTMNSRQIYGICHDLRLLNDYCASYGAEFIFTSVPNKNSLYPENMPMNYVPADSKGNYELIADELSGDSFFLDMKSALAGTSSSIPLYHKTDTHWNNLGAYAGHCAIMTKLGKSPCPAEDGWHTEQNARLGDLAEMIYPAEPPKDTQAFSGHQFAYQYQGHFRALDDITINTVSESGQGSLLMYRDSFGEAILPYMAEQFASAEFSRVVPYRTDSIANGNADTVILEIVERNLPRLAKEPPVMPAPLTELPAVSSDYGTTDGTEVYITKDGSRNFITGALPEALFTGGEYRVILTAGGVSYEAFIASEYSDCGCGFSAYVPDEFVSAGDITVTVENAGGNALFVTIPSENLIRKDN